MRCCLKHCYLQKKKIQNCLALPTRPCAVRALGNLWLYLVPRSPLWPLQLSDSLCTLAVSTASPLVCCFVSLEFSLLSPLSPLPG